MMAQHLADWLHLLEGTCSVAGIAHLDLIIDQAAGKQPFLAGVQGMAPAMPWRSLFDGLPEESAIALAPCWCG
ncbi:hypothetical protein [Pseudomonas sp. PSKL.D1]|uniref:hypothetical protein n=1 Tax=Pseudomonas sp. PSKL.D1 TaxID=3029060 RepID=UPI002380E3AE|nr:hypothetical protein [Pseudomonas sp. PSKL.D1]WDY55582.1 hypothetical protein PVV54_13255 [Pseudomonas sp. PSKL.D1]